MYTLTDRQQRFVFEYLKDQNASAAAQRAGYSARSRASQASTLMNDPAVRERIRIEMQSLLAELRLSALDLMKERMRAAFFRAGKLFDASGRLLGFEEMEAEVRDSLVIGGKWCKGVEEVRFRMPNREPALRALERVHERLDRLNEAHYAALEKERARQEAAPAAKHGTVPPGMWNALVLEEPASVQTGEGGGQDEPPVEVAPTAPADNFPEKTHGLSGSATTNEVKEPAPTTVVVEPPAEAPAADTAVARSNLNPGAPLIKRRAPDLMWGGKRGPTPEPEPSPALQEHLMRVRHAELNEEARRNLEARGGRIKPGPLRPQGLPPGYNPPWLRDDRPQFAIGAGECSLDD